MIAGKPFLYPLPEPDVLVDELLRLGRIFKLHLHGAAIGNRHEMQVHLIHLAFKVLWLFPPRLHVIEEGLDVVESDLACLAERQQHVLVPVAAIPGVCGYSDLETRSGG